MNDQNSAPAPGAFTDTAALDQLQHEASEAAPAATPGAAPIVDRTEQHTAEARMLISFGLDLIGAKVGVTFDADTKAEGAERLVPVLAKHGGVMPSWLVPYKEEFALGVWAAGVAFKVWQTVQEAKAVKAPAPAPAAAPGADDAQAG